MFPDDQLLSEGVPVDPPRPSFLRRRGLAIIAVLLTLVVLVALAWYAIAQSINHDFSDDLGQECTGASPGEVFENFTSYAPVPNVPDLADARRAFLALVGSDRYRIELRSTDSDGGDDVGMTIVRDGEALEFRRDNGTIGRVTPDRTLLSTTDSSFWLSSCRDPSITLFPPGDSGKCISRITEGTKETFHYRGIPKSADCSATLNTLDYRVVVDRGRLVSWSLDLTTEAGTAHDEWVVMPTDGLDDPWPWQVVPGWFVRLVL